MNSSQRPAHQLFTAACSLLFHWMVAAPVAYGQGAPSSSDVLQTGVQDHPDLLEENGFLTVSGSNGSYRLEFVAVRRSNVQGRLPIALLAHGKPRLPSDMALIRPGLLAREARDLAYRGYLAVGIIRRGFGRSGGTPGVATNAPFAKCSVDDLQRYFDVEADDLEAALSVVASRRDADSNRVIVIGGSVGGGLALALAARKLPGMIAAVNIAGGVRITNAQMEVVCPYETAIAAIARFGSGNKVPSIWIYSENDSVFAPKIARQAYEAFRAAGGLAEFVSIPALQPDGHNAFELPDGRVHWLAATDQFLRRRGLPTWNTAQVDQIMQTARIPASSRAMLEKYLSLYTPKVLLQAPDGRVTYTANTRSLASAREAGLANCQKWAKSACRVVMENFTSTKP